MSSLSRKLGAWAGGTYDPGSWHAQKGFDQRTRLWDLLHSPSGDSPYFRFREKQLSIEGSLHPFKPKRNIENSVKNLRCRIKINFILLNKKHQHLLLIFPCSIVHRSHSMLQYPHFFDFSENHFSQNNHKITIYREYKNVTNFISAVFIRSITDSLCYTLKIPNFSRLKQLLEQNAKFINRNNILEDIKTSTIPHLFFHIIIFH